MLVWTFEQTNKHPKLYSNYAVDYQTKDTRKESFGLRTQTGQLMKLWLRNIYDIFSTTSKEAQDIPASEPEANKVT